MPDETDERIESSGEESEATSRDSLLAEASASQSILVDKQKGESNHLKDGGKSGVTDDFGKPLLVDDTVGGAAAADAPPRKLRREARLADTSALPSAQDGRDYRGEGIDRSIEPGKHTCQAGETTTSIARDHLGPFASDEDVRKYATEIQKINDLWHEAVEHNKVLNLPGRTTDGKFVYIDAAGTERTVSSDGSYEVKFKNGGSMSRQYQADGSYTETHTNKDGTETSYTHKPGPPADSSGYVEEHTGTRAADTYSIEKTSDGRYKLKDRSGERIVGAYDDRHPDIRVERVRIRDLAEQKISDPAERKRFKQDMDRFEQRSRQLEDLYIRQHPGMRSEDARKKAEEEVARTYHELSRVLEAPDNPQANLTAERRTKIVEQFMSHAADPTTIDQGLHPTCQTNTVEMRTFTTDPSKAARLIADVTTTGEYTTPEGKLPDGKTGTTHVKLDLKKTLDPQDSSMRYPPDDDHRSYVSKIFQVTAINVELKRTGYLDSHGNPVSPYKPGDVHYEERARDTKLNPPDTGSRLIDSSGNEIKDGSGKPVLSPSLTEDQITDMSNAITGQNEKAVVIDSADYVCGDGKRVIKVNTEAELESALADAKAKGKLPIIVKIDPVNQPFWSDGGAGVAGSSAYAGAATMDRQQREVEAPALPEPAPGPGPGPGPQRTDGAHVVTITDYQPAQAGPPPQPARVELDNSWGKKADHTGDDAVSVHDLYLAMHRSGRQKGDSGQTIDGIVDLLRKDVQGGKADTATKLELLRQETMHEPPLITPQQYDSEVTKVYIDAINRWKEQEAQGTLDHDERDKAQTQLYSILVNLSRERQQAILAKLLPETQTDYQEWQTGMERNRSYWIMNTLRQLWGFFWGR